MAEFNMKQVWMALTIAAVAIVVTGFIGSFIPEIFALGFLGINSLGQVLTLTIGVFAGTWVSSKILKG